MADAGPNQNVRQGSRSNLTGEGSRDPDGRIVSYSWYLVSSPPGSSGIILEPNSMNPRPNFTAPGVPGDYILGLIVKDNRGASSAPSYVAIRVLSPFEAVAGNQPPIADAGDNQNVTQGMQVTLNGTSGRDRNNATINTIASYSWYLVSSPPGSSAIDAKPNSTVAIPQFTAPGVPGNYIFELIVKDNRGASSAPDFVVITVVPPPSSTVAGAANQQPIANAGSDQTAVKPGDTVILNGSNSIDRDLGGTIASYSWYLVSSPPGSSAIDAKPNSTVAIPQFTAPRVPGNYIFELIVKDNRGASSAPDFVVITVLSPTTQPITIEQPLTVDITSSGTEGIAPATFEFGADVTGGTEPYTYRWDFGDGRSSDEQTVSHTFEKAGTYNVRLTVIGSTTGRTASDSIRTTVVEQPRPSLTSVDITSSGTEGIAPATFEFGADVTGGTEPYTYRWGFGDGSSEESDDDAISHTFEEAGTYNVRLTVIDSSGQRASDSIRITVEEQQQQQVAFSLPSGGGNTPTEL